MAHELTKRANGKVEFAYLESHGSPWHKLGTPMPDNTPLEGWRTAAGMEWELKRSQVMFTTPDGITRDEERDVLWRGDNHYPLGVVSRQYKEVQPRQMLDFFQGIARSGGLELSAAGTIYGGKRFWATAKIGEASPVSVRDKIGAYLLISSSADGSLATDVRLTTVRVVCRNTLQLASNTKVSLRVTHRSEFDAAKAQSLLSLDTAPWDAFQAQMKALASKPLTRQDAADIVLPWYMTATKDADDAKKSAGYKRILQLFSGEALGSELDGVQGTAYGLLQATTEYVDRHTRSRSESSQFASSQWGPGAALKSKAFNDLLVLV